MSFGNGNGNGESVVSAPLGTGMGAFVGTLKDVPARELGATVVVRGVVGRSGIRSGRADRVFVGARPSAGRGMNPGRRVGTKSGLPVANARGRS
jgi:acetyl-CoA C-acetyltransferase